MPRTLLVVLVLLAGCGSMQDVRIRSNGDGSSGGNGQTQPSSCVARSSVSITASPMDLVFPTPTAVSWFARLPDDCPYLNVQLSRGVVNPNFPPDDPRYVQLTSQAVEPVGARTFTPTSTMLYVALVGDTSGSSSGTTSASVTVTVSGVPDKILIDSTTLDPVNVLIGALTASPNPKQVVELCGDDLKLDFGGRKNIVVSSFRTLRAAPGCERSLRRLGPLVFSPLRGGGPLFVIRGIEVEFSGFRLQGPEAGLGTDENGGAVGIQILPWGCDSGQPNCVLPPLQHVEISNMEISQWDIAGVEVRDTQGPRSELGRLWNTNVGAVHIKNNFIHDNRHMHIGYGVVASDGGYALIEQNVFNQNRHAIAGSSKDPTGRDFSGYTARDNLILPGGGLHCQPVCWHTHIVDMHGDDNDLGLSANCGKAGETMMIERNTILYTNGTAIKIRGNPVDKAVVDHNVFAHGNQVDAIAQNGECNFWWRFFTGFWVSQPSGYGITNPIKVTPTNVFGADPMSQLGSCHFAGDEVQDQFMATGVTWWVRSGLTGQWRYLNTMSEKVSELQFQDFDGDGICDVLPRLRFPVTIPTKYSKGGTTPWLPVGVIPPNQ